LYDPESKGSQSYLRLARELLELEHKWNFRTVNKHLQKKKIKN
jgi:hypothetical protein